MKVALIAEWMDAWRGGAETSTQQFIHHLMDAGVELHVFTRSRPSPTPGMNVHSINGAAMTRTRRSMTFAHRVERQLLSSSFDVVHAISPCRFADIYQPRGGTVAETIARNIATRAPGAPRRLKRYAARFNLRQRYVLALERRLFGADAGPAVVAISDYVVRQLKDHYGLADERIHKVYNGVDPDPADAGLRAHDREAIRREFRVADDDLLVLSVAHNFRLKGVHCWMEALAGMVSKGVDNIRSLVIGRGETHAWHRLAGRLGLGDVLTFVGPSDRVRRFYRAADVVVHPTFYDPCSRVVLEAMVAGVPCVTTRWDGASEIVSDGENGFVLDDPRDTAELSRCVEQLGDSARRSEMSRAAAAVADRVSMARHTAEMISLYERIGERTRRAS